MNLPEAKNLYLLLLLPILLTAVLACSCQKTIKEPGAAPLTKIDRGDMLKILFLGDTSFGESYGSTPKLLKKRGYDYPLLKVAPMLKSSDFVIANLETAVTDLAETEDAPYAETKSYNHWTHPEYAPLHLAKHNIKTVSLANNHTMDYGTAGLKDSFAALKKHGVTWFGAGLNEEEAAAPFRKTFTFKGKDFKIAVIGAYQYSSKYDKEYHFYAKGDLPGAYRLHSENIAGQIKQIKAADPSTYVIVFPHWGKNYRWKDKKQTRYAHAFINAGADLVVGHGGHAMQEIERYNNRWIVYGIGNFMFLSPGRYSKLKFLPYSYGAQLILVDRGGKTEKWMRLYPIFSNNRVSKYQARPLDNHEFEKFTEALMEKSPLDQNLKKLVHKGKDDAGNYLEFRIE